MTGRVALWDGHLLARRVMSSSYTLYYTIGMKWLGDAHEGIESVLWLTRLLDCDCDVVIYAFYTATAVGSKVLEGCGADAGDLCIRTFYP
jgi:hypothetical protein